MFEVDGHVHQVVVTHMRSQLFRALKRETIDGVSCGTSTCVEFHAKRAKLADESVIDVDACALVQFGRLLPRARRCCLAAVVLLPRPAFVVWQERSVVTRIGAGAREAAQDFEHIKLAKLRQRVHTDQR